MPKKKKKGKKKPAEEVAGTIDDEISKVEDELLQYEAQATILDNTITETETKIHQNRMTVKDHRQELKDQFDMYEDEVQDGEEDFETQYLTDRQTLEELGQQNEALKIEVAASEAIAEENDALRAQIVELSEILSRQTQEQEEELTLRNKERFDTRLAMERTFREHLRTTKTKLENDAIAEIEQESKEAVVNNVSLKADLDRRGRHIRAMCQRYDASSDQLGSIKIATDLTRERNEMQTEQILALESTNATMKRDIFKFQAQLKREDEQDRLLLAQLARANTENADLEQEAASMDGRIERLLQQVETLNDLSRDPRQRKAYRQSKQQVREVSPADSSPRTTTTSTDVVDMEKIWNSEARGHTQLMF